MDHSKHVALTQTEFTAEVLEGAPIYGANDVKLGKISHIHGSGASTEVVVDVGGFLGIGAKPVLLSVNQLNLMRDEAGVVHGATSWTKDDLKNLPTHHH